MTAYIRPTERYVQISAIHQHNDRIVLTRFIGVLVDEIAIKNVEHIFYIGVWDDKQHVCLVIKKAGEPEASRYIISKGMAASLIHHVNRRKFFEPLGVEEEMAFFETLQ